MSNEKTFVFYHEGYDAYMASFDLPDSALELITRIKTIEQNEKASNGGKYGGTSLDHVIIGKEFDVEPIQIATKWRIKDN